MVEHDIVRERKENGVRGCIMGLNLTRWCAHCSTVAAALAMSSSMIGLRPTVCEKCTLYCNSFDRQRWIVADVDSTRFFPAITFECLTDLDIRLAAY